MKQLLAITSLMALLTGPAMAAPSKLKQVFDPEMLSADLPYFELVTGPARNTHRNTKIYKVDGCEVTATLDGGAIQSLRLELSPSCTFDLNKFLHGYGKFPAPHLMTFGQFDALTGNVGQFMTDCLNECGNITDPSVYEYRSGPHSDGWLDVMLEVKLGDTPSIDASFKWAKAMKKTEGEEWVLQTKFNCQLTKYDTVARNAFKKVRITAITVGHNIKTPGHGLSTPWSSANDCSGG
jgi:hypothetical protein